jgi:hypothetical protein
MPNSFSSFRIGDEEIRNTRLRIGAIGIAEADMLIGADFFLSHRIYVASSQHKLYFTYNGGPLFNLNAEPPPAPPNGPPPEVAGSPAPTARAPGVMRLRSRNTICGSALMPRMRAWARRWAGAAARGRCSTRNWTGRCPTATRHTD